MRAVRAPRPGDPAQRVLSDLAAVEELGRLVDHLRITAAAVVEEQSRPVLGEERLSFRSGARDGAEPVQQVSRIGDDEAKRRVALGSSLAPRRSLLGDSLPGKFAPLAEAVAAGSVGIGSARVTVNTWKSPRRRVPVATLDGMVVRLTEAAKVDDVEHLRDLAAAWSEIIDPEAHHRRQSGLHRDPRLDELRRAHDPDRHPWARPRAA